MFNEKLKYYRKKSLLTQEELASQLNVSRQIVTKWEKGLVLPNLEYLIDLSLLFGVTIDTLVKEDDCVSIKENNISHDELIDFLIQAKKQTYASKLGKVNASRLASHDYAYAKGHYSYLDSFVGTSRFSGEEVVYKDNEPVWSMNYYGRVIQEHFDGDFLKEALKQVPMDKPYRGPESYTKGDYCYHSRVDGDVFFFQGYEDIFYQDQKIYEGLYHGGILE